MTLKNQKDATNKIRWVMSRFADCKKLNSIYNGPVRLVLTRSKQLFKSRRLCSHFSNKVIYYQNTSLDYTIAVQ